MRNGFSGVFFCFSSFSSDTLVHVYTLARCVSKFLAGFLAAISIKLLHDAHTVKICIAWPCRGRVNKKKAPQRFGLIGFPCSTVIQRTIEYLQTFPRESRPNVTFSRFSYTRRILRFPAKSYRTNSPTLSADTDFMSRQPFSFERFPPQLRVYSTSREYRFSRG